MSRHAVSLRNESRYSRSNASRRRLLNQLPRKSPKALAGSPKTIGTKHLRFFSRLHRQDSNVSHSACSEKLALPKSWSPGKAVMAGSMDLGSFKSIHWSPSKFCFSASVMPSQWHLHRCAIFGARCLAGLTRASSSLPALSRRSRAVKLHATVHRRLS